jgi:hypothetical protein
MKYQSEEFDHAAKSFKHSHYADESVIIAALRIAAAVAKPGVIETALDNSELVTMHQLACAIRKAVGA